MPVVQHHTGRLQLVDKLLEDAATYIATSCLQPLVPLDFSCATQ